MASEIQFGSVLDRDGPSKAWWLLIVPVIVGIGAVIWWGMNKVSGADALAVQVKQQSRQLTEYEDTVKQRDVLLAKAHAEEDLLTSPGQATSVLYQATPEATESGVVIANPSQKAARVYLYGLGTPPQGQQYAVVARGPQGVKVLGRVLASDQGDAFLLARDVPEGTTAIELAYVPLEEKKADGGAASQGVGSAGGGEAAGPAADDVKARVAARYPATEKDRGVLLQPVEETAHARKAKRR